MLILQTCLFNASCHWFLNWAERLQPSDLYPFPVTALCHLSDSPSIPTKGEVWVVFRQCCDYYELWATAVRSVSVPLEFSEWTKCSCCRVKLLKKLFVRLCFRQGHEMCALLILGEISDSSLINATNAALQMWVLVRLWLRLIPAIDYQP